MTASTRPYARLATFTYAMRSTTATAPDRGAALSQPHARERDPDGGIRRREVQRRHRHIYDYELSVMNDTSAELARSGGPPRWRWDVALARCQPRRHSQGRQQARSKQPPGMAVRFISTSQAPLSQPASAAQDPLGRTADGPRHWRGRARERIPWCGTPGSDPARLLESGAHAAAISKCRLSSGALCRRPSCNSARRRPTTSPRREDRWFLSGSCD